MVLKVVSRWKQSHYRICRLHRVHHFPCALSFNFVADPDFSSCTERFVSFETSPGHLLDQGELNVESFPGETFTGTELMTLQHEHIVKATDISKDANWAVTGTQDKKLRLFDLDNPDKPVLFGQGGVAHSSPIRAVVLDMSRKLILSVDDNEIKSVFFPLFL